MWGQGRREGKGSGRTGRLTEEVATTTSADTRLPSAVFEGHLEGHRLAPLLGFQRLRTQSTHLQLLKLPHEVVVAHPRHGRGNSEKNIRSDAKNANNSITGTT